MLLIGAILRSVLLTSPSGATQLESHEKTDVGVKWDCFLSLAQHHRLYPILSQGLSNPPSFVPAGILQELRSGAAANAIEAFRYLAELQRLLSLLGGAGVEATILKGVPLSVLAFGNTATRDVGDIDLLIKSEDAESADLILQKTGSVRQEPAGTLTRKRRAFYITYHKDFTYSAQSHGFEIDLHWRLLRDRHTSECLLSTNTLDPFTSLKIGSMEMKVLSKPHCLVYLAVHGAMEGWARWKSLVDIAALWIRATETERSSTWALAEKCSAASFLSAALGLSRDWLQLPLDQDHQLSSRRDPLARYIVRYSTTQMVEHAWMPSPAGITSLAMKWHEVRLRPSPRSLRDLAMRILFRSRMWEVLDLPDSLFFLYALLSPFEWLHFRAKTLRSRS